MFYMDGSPLRSPAAPAKPSISSSAATFSVGDPVELTCSGSAASYEWSKDGAVVNGENTSTLAFASFANTDTAAYTCVALSASSVRSPASDSLQLSPQGERVLPHCSD